MLPPLQSNVFFLVGVQQFILSQIYGMTENPNNNANYFNPAQGHGRRSIHCFSPDPDCNHNPAFVKDFDNYYQDQGQNEEGSVGADYDDLEHLPAS